MQPTWSTSLAIKYAILVEFIPCLPSSLRDFSNLKEKPVSYVESPDDRIFGDFQPKP